MGSVFFDEIDKSLPSYLEIFANKSLDIIEQIHFILEKKGLTQKDLAKSLGKSESEISKWLSGGHNLTLKTLAKMEDVLGEEIVVTPARVKVKFEILQEASTSEKMDNHDSWECELSNGCVSDSEINRFSPLVNY